MNEFIELFNEIISFPEVIINQCTFIPEFVRASFLKSLYFVPILSVLYYLIGLLEKFFLANIRLFIKLLRNFKGIFGAAIGIVPECTYSVLTSIFYSRNIISRGTLFACLIMCCDDALPVLFIEPAKAWVIIPVLVIKFVIAVAVSFIVDIAETIFNLRIKHQDELNTMNTDIKEAGCCHHMMNTDERYPNILKHTFVHTLNMFMFVFLSLTLVNGCIQAFGSVSNLASVLMIDSIISIFAVAAIGLISNCAVSVLIAVAYVAEIISFPAFLAGMVTVTGLGLFKLFKRGKSKDANLTAFVLYLTGIIAGLAVYYNILGLGSVSSVFIR